MTLLFAHRPLNNQWYLIAYMRHYLVCVTIATFFAYIVVLWVVCAYV
jgi:hypothetical protein